MPEDPANNPKPDTIASTEDVSVIEMLTGGRANRTTSVLTLGGYFFLIVSAAALGVEVFNQWRGGAQIPLSGNPDKILDGWALAVAFSSHIFLLLTAVMGAVIGYALLGSAGASFKEVIPQKDAILLYELLRGDKTTGLDNYVKLASLSGFAGTCFKLGITGLPLATIALTIFFAIIGLFPGQASQGFLDLSKLTLGAFIGSFVQRARLDFGDTADDKQRKKDTPGNVG